MIGHDPWFNFRPTVKPVTSCQKFLADALFTLTYKDLRRIKKFIFSGHVKNSTRGKWEPKFTGEIQDMSSEVARIWAIPASQLPPPRYCGIPCAYWDIVSHGTYDAPWLS
ncbi:hypothetical protein EJ02DRAFT_122571 [Clathrospora elynae]|uniref:Uncharacterized protein n=1 Tax=Clathrospora elynae TaxID=706981 RepID=A0A6A5SUD9_9PLEO|nr:hypothetical protein EJ02DRAFT_122571 [Clathrospora elynae]